MSRDNEPAYATAAAVAGVASELESLRTQMQPLHELPSRVEQLAALVDQLAGQVRDSTAAPAPEQAVASWLMAPEDVDATRELLDELTVWLGQVFLRYADGAAALPECWAWHPDVVEELVWLQQAWLNAYQGAKASIALVGDWHDRQRPGVVRRIKASAGTCSLENHTPPGAPAVVPVSEAVPVIADWWAESRDEPAPEPTEDQLNAAPRRRGGGARR